MKHPLESAIQRTLIDYLKLRGHLVVRFNNIPIEKNGVKIPVRQKGVADLLVCKKGGQFVAVEVKRPNTKPTPEQEAFLESVHAAGGLGFVARSIEDLQHQGL